MPPNAAASARLSDKSARGPQPAAPSAPASAAASRASSRASSPLPARPAERNGRHMATPPRPAQPVTPGTAKLIRTFLVAGVTVEVVRQNSTIIYRLPGNMPVSSLTPEQRTMVMSEIQRMRSSSGAPAPATPGRPVATPTKPAGARMQPAMPRATPKRPGEQTLRTAESPGSARHSRPAPSLPSIAPRQAPPFAANSGTSGLLSAPAAGRFPAPPQSPHGAARPRAQQPALPKMPTSALAPRRLQPGPGPSPGAAQTSALERMYQSAYLRLLKGPTEALRKLNPPAELTSILGGPIDGTLTPQMLLLVLKALTKAQASQLASMHDREARIARGQSDTNLAARSISNPASQPPSGAASPTGSHASGAELDSMPGSPGPGAATPTKRRKYNKTGKYSSKNRAAWSLGSPGGGSVSPSDQQPQSQLPRGVFAHPDVCRSTVAPLAARRKSPALLEHESEIRRRFRKALEMDHQMVENPDWRTPFSGTQDVIQRLLPFHVFQYHDRDIDSASAREERRIQGSTRSLESRLAALRQRHEALVVSEGGDNHYHVDNIQIERQRIDAARAELDRLRSMQLQRDIASMGAGLPDGL
ncbi:hypothetical protein LPJ61_000660 [Coemansia biformis]|uniref:GLTSCR protein conserved domain-containing protein n=1 Tax=Coemansia biformis TaxID=1286918 RepID=A0A9W8D0U6_9FUNG|nr:hypothetical protein LPJ61_000660 [Coemansia biformis]